MEIDDPHPTATRVIEGVDGQIESYETLRIFLETFAAVPREGGLLYAVWRCDYEVCNGGFHQFFNNNAGMLTPEAIEGYVAIGQPQLAALVTRAQEKLSNADVRDFRARWAALERMPEDAFRELDEKYYELRKIEGGGFEQAIERYAKATAGFEADRSLR